MESELLSLSWNNHSDELISILQHLLSSNTLIDCTLAAEGQYLKAHKVVLSACSPYFKLLFSQESEKNPIVILKDVKFKQLKAVVDFMYCGEVKIPENELQAFFEIAALLCIKGFCGDNNELQRTVIPEFCLPESKEHYSLRENSNSSDSVCVSIQPCGIRNSDTSIELPLYHQTCNTVASTAITPCIAPSTYNTTSNSAPFASIDQEKQNNSEKHYSIPSVQLKFNSEKEVHANYETVVKTECDADIYEDTSTVFVDETICENISENTMKGGSDEIAENTEFVSNQSTSPHQYSCYIGSIPKDFHLTDNMKKKIANKRLNNKIIKRQNWTDGERRQEKQKQDLKASAVSLLAQKVRKSSCLTRRHKPRAEMNECELLIARNRTRERVRKYRERKKAERQISFVCSDEKLVTRVNVLTELTPLL